MNMPGPTREDVRQNLERTFREESGRGRAALIGGLRHFELPGDVLEEAFLVALERWPDEGLPAHPAAWLSVTARRKAIDRLRRAQVLARKQVELQVLTE